MDVSSFVLKGIKQHCHRVKTLMLKSALYRLTGAIAPSIRNNYSERLLFREADRLAHLGDTTDDIATLVRAVLSSRRFRVQQISTEISALLRLIWDLQPQRICEIGACRGGTTFLFGQVVAPGGQLLSMDLRYPMARIGSNSRLCRNRAQITCLAADSHAPGTLDSVRQWLAGDPLDVLFIDGDHSFDGVRQDFEMYSPLVRPGGLIAFHDIHPDFMTRYGIRTKSNGGEVPRFWQSVKRRYPDAREFIADSAQDGYGIGVVSV